MSPRFLIGQLVSFGDCLYVTAVARQIKEDYPGSHLTWAVTSKCRAALEGNPFIDEIWEIALPPGESSDLSWSNFKVEAEARKAAGRYDEIFFTQFMPAYADRFDGNIRSSHFRGYPGQIKVVQPILALNPTEITNATIFAKDKGLSNDTFNILFEAEPLSGQGCYTFADSLKVAGEIAAMIPHSRIVVSSGRSFIPATDSILDGSGLTIRETVALSNHCSLLIGGSSGITWGCTSSAAGKIPMLQLHNTSSAWLNSVCLDHKRWNLDHDHVVELSQHTMDRFLPCVAAICRDGVGPAKSRYHEVIRENRRSFVYLSYHALSRGRRRQGISLLATYMDRYGSMPGKVGASLCALYILSRLALICSVKRGFEMILKAVNRDGSRTG